MRKLPWQVPAIPPSHPLVVPFARTHEICQVADVFAPLKRYRDRLDRFPLKIAQEPFLHCDKMSPVLLVPEVTGIPSQVVRKVLPYLFSKIPGYAHLFQYGWVPERSPVYHCLKLLPPVPQPLQVGLELAGEWPVHDVDIDILRLAMILETAASAPVALRDPKIRPVCRNVACPQISFPVYKRFYHVRCYFVLLFPVLAELP
jgi:hypothetical protein